MLLIDAVEVPIPASLGFIVSVLVTATMASSIAERRSLAQADRQGDARRTPGDATVRSTGRKPAPMHEQ